MGAPEVERFGAAFAIALVLSLGAGAGGEEEAPAQAPGPALRAAIALEASGDAAGAAERFGAIARAVPEIADHASELRIEALVKAGANDAAVAEAQAFRARFSHPWLVQRVWVQEAAAQAAAGHEEPARAALSAALELLPESESDARARLIEEIARSHERSGEHDAAAESWRLLWTRYATSAEAQDAEQALARLAAADSSFAYRTPAALHERCLRFSAALRNEEALESCEAALAAAPGDRSLQRERADVLFRLRRYSDAVEAFRALGDDDRLAVYWRGRSLARAGRSDEALATFARVAKDADPELAARARFLSATLLEDTDLAAAEAGYRAVEKRGPTAELRSSASWRLAWLAWQHGELRAAVKVLERYVAETEDPAERVRGRYWLARGLERLGRAEGRAQLARIASEEPLSYYGWRAADRVAPRSPAPKVDVAAAPPVTAAAPASFPADALRRIQILLEAGLDERATVEIRPLAAGAGSPALRLALGQLLLEAGRFHLAQRLVVDRDGATLVRRPAPGEEALWWLAWPTAYDRTVEHAARAHGVEPALVYAIMREESGYQPDALSVVGARGLTQIMPATGRRLASDLGAADFDPAELFRPDRNLELGAFYLSELVGRFDGRMSAAIASYNAGPEAVSRWLAAGAGHDDDEWVESIPYDQTRGYVKRVLRSLNVYRTLYGS